ncbi:hypothetical protein MBLNU13_g05325t1 [Cladosporium sp. NU13]
MGVPFSKEMDTAVAAVQTAKNVFIFLTALVVILVVILTFLLLAVFALLVTTNPDLEHERAMTVTPAVKWAIRRLSSLVSVLNPRKEKKCPKTECPRDKSR